MATREIQREPFVDDDLTPYRGAWVAIRDGKVIASALDPVELRDRPDHHDDDLLLLVPTETSGVMLL
jgi:hypothetical protein